MTQTTKCIKCGKQAKKWTGHILKRNGDTVLAGWCSGRCIHKWIGYHGLFRKKYGEQSVC